MCLTVAAANVTQLFKETLLFQLLSTIHCYCVPNLDTASFVHLTIKCFILNTLCMAVCCSTCARSAPPPHGKKTQPTSLHHFRRSDLTLNMFLFSFGLGTKHSVYPPTLTTTQWPLSTTIVTPQHQQFDMHLGLFNAWFPLLH